MVVLLQGMDLSHDHLMSISYTHGDAHLRPLENEITNLRRQIQANKQIISQNKYSVEIGIDDFRLGDVSSLIFIAQQLIENILNSKTIRFIISTMYKVVVTDFEESHCSRLMLR